VVILFILIQSGTPKPTYLNWEKWKKFTPFALCHWGYLKHSSTKL